MSKALTRLHTLESEINEASYEHFYYVGQRLAEIKSKELYKEEGFRSWSAYCVSGRIEYSTSQADRLIVASELRPSLPKPPPIGGESGVWTESQVRELAVCETPADAKRVAKKAIAEAKKAKKPVTAKLISQIRDGDEETGAARKRVDKRLHSARLEKHLDELATLLVEWRTSLEKVALEQWEELPPVILARVRREAKALNDFLQS